MLYFKSRKKQSHLHILLPSGHTTAEVTTMETALTDENIRQIFTEASDFIVRRLNCGDHTLYAYAIDGLIASANAASPVFMSVVCMRRR